MKRLIIIFNCIGNRIKIYYSVKNGKLFYGYNKEISLYQSWRCCLEENGLGVNECDKFNDFQKNLYTFSRASELEWEDYITIHRIGLDDLKKFLKANKGE